MKNLELIKKIKEIPAKPGVYFWKNKYGNVIYIGKAKNLKERLQEYFNGALNSYKTPALLKDISDFEITVLSSEKEALLYERNLIHEYKPHYNILLTDDTRYPYIRIQLKKNRIDINYVRIIKRKSDYQSLYYGPFPAGNNVKVLLKLLQREIWYQKGLKINSKDPQFWETQFFKIKNFLRFDNHQYLKNLKEEMLLAASKEQYEIAADIKKSLECLLKMREQQVVQLKNDNHIDAIAFEELEGFIFFTFSIYRYGILINLIQRTIKIKTSFENTVSEFLNAYYELNPLPEIIVLDRKYENLNLSFWEEVKLIYPQRGIYKEILKRAWENTMTNIKLNKEKALKDEEARQLEQRNLASFLGIEIPRKIILIDNSHVANTLPVSVIVSFWDGIKNTSQYRKFNLQESKTRQADVEYMKEAMSRYLKMDYKPSDLIIIDGSYPQLHEIKKIFKEKNLNQKIIALVKDDFHRTRSLIDLNEKQRRLNKHTPLYHFLTRMQIEVDRFAKAHRSKRATQKTLEGSLQKIPGIGPFTEKRLLEKFQTYAQIYNAGLEDLEKVVSKKIAKAILEKFS